MEAKSRRSRWVQWLLSGIIVTVGVAPIVQTFLVARPRDQWQVDLEVYREAGVSAIWGRPIYTVLTEAPQLLPFTYPPFAAVLAIPLALIPFGVLGWIWTGAQILANVVIVAYAARGLIRDSDRRNSAPLIIAVLCVGMLYLQPVADGIRFGQVNAFIVLLVVLDLGQPRPRFLRAVPPGVLVGIATAIKLTPGVFIIHYLACRRWREAAAAIGSAVAVTLGAWAVLPAASVTFWASAIFDSDRLGVNTATANQSLRGLVLRIGPDGTAGTVVWLVLVAVVASLGFALARQRYRAGDWVSEVAVVGLLACLLSPVAWIHHFHWIVLVIFAVLGSKPDRRRIIAAGVLLVWFWMRLPWWGIRARYQWGWPELLGIVMQNADTLGATVALVLIYLVNRRHPSR